MRVRFPGGSELTEYPTQLRAFALATGLLWVTTAVAQSTDTLTPSWKACADQILNVFENESTSPKYDYIENLNDGRGYTAGQRWPAGAFQAS
jgi:Glycosyl hydrolase family 46